MGCVPLAPGVRCPELASVSVDKSPSVPVTRETVTYKYICHLPKSFTQKCEHCVCVCVCTPMYDIVCLQLAGYGKPDKHPQVPNHHPIFLHSLLISLLVHSASLSLVFRLSALSHFFCVISVLQAKLIKRLPSIWSRALASHSRVGR